LSSPLWPEHRLFSVWEDFGRTFHASSGAPLSGVQDVGLQISNAPTTDATDSLFPLSADHNYYKVNVLRRGLSFPAPTATAVYSSTARNATFGPQDMFDGTDYPFRWQALIGPNMPGADPNATATVTIDLRRVVLLGAMRQYFLDGMVRTPLNFQL